MITSNYQRQRFPEDRKGALVPLVGFMLVIIFGMCSFVADTGNLIVVKTTLGAAADAAALAGAGSMAQSYQLDEVRAEAVNYGQANLPANYGAAFGPSNVQFGTWNPETRVFSPDPLEPNAVRVEIERSADRGNPVPYFFAKLFGLESTDLKAVAIAVGANSTSTPLYEVTSVYVTSSRDLSNVVLQFEDGSHQKFEGLSSYSGTFQGVGQHAGKQITGVWIKSGCYSSGDGPGYGEYVARPDDPDEYGFTVHGDNQHKGCVSHVTATFGGTGVEFSSSGAITPVRLVF